MKTNLLLIILCLLSLETAATTHTNDYNKSIELPNSWQSTFMGGLFYDADFVLTDSTTRDIILINLYPQDLLINNQNIPLKKNDIKTLIAKFNILNGDEAFLTETEEILEVKKINRPQLNGVVFKTKYKVTGTTNYHWLGNANNHTILLKIITKPNQPKKETSEIVNLVKNLNISQAKTSPKKTEKNHSTKSSYELLNTSKLHKKPNHYKIDTYKHLNAVYTENNKQSIYAISSFCSDFKIPHAALKKTILNNFGIDNVLYEGKIKDNTQLLDVTIGQYTSSDDTGYRSMATIIENENCQYVLVYVLENGSPLVNNFIEFIHGFKPLNIKKEDYIKNLPIEFRPYYATTIESIGNYFYNLKNYQKALKLYVQANLINPNDTYISYILTTFNKTTQYQAAIKFILEHKKQNFTTDTIIWLAWFYSKSEANENAIKTFATVIDKFFTNDEDVFKYLELLINRKDYQKAQTILTKYFNNISNKQDAKLQQAKIYSLTDKTKAKTYLLQLLTDESMLQLKQFDLLDLLIEMEDFDDVIKFCQQRIQQGFESGVLYNYLGDAYNSKKDYANALKYMKKSHQMMPNNTTITAYYETLLNRTGKSDLQESNRLISLVALPEVIKNKIQHIKTQNNKDSYEYLYIVKSFYHKKNQKNKKTIYVKIKINNKSGVAKNKTLRFGFNQDYENAYINYLNILDENNSIITQYDESAIYITTDKDGINADDDKTINIPIPSLASGTTIEYAYTVESKTASDYQPFVDEMFVNTVSTHYKAVVLSGDIENITVITSKDVKAIKLSERLKYWEYQNLPIYKKTPLMPDFKDIFPWMVFSTTAKNWQEAGDEYLNMIENKLHTKIDPKLIKSILSQDSHLETAKTEHAQIIPQTTSLKNENAKKIISFVQDTISYQALEFGWRAQIPNNSLTTLKNKYGDCKDHAVLLIDMLNAIGVKANLALVNSGDDIIPQLTNHNQFNHVIVYLPEINHGVFIDTTDKDSALDFKNPPYGLQGNHALILQKNDSKLVKITELKAKNNVFNISRTVNKKDKRYHYQENIKINGYYASYLRSYLKSIELDEMESQIIGWISNYYADLRLDSFSFNNLYDNLKPLELNFKFSQDIKFANILLPVFTERYMLEFTQSPNRKWDFDFNTSFTISSITKINSNNNLEFNIIDNKNTTKLMDWHILSDKQHLKFESTIFNNRMKANYHQELINQSKNSYKIIENSIKATQDTRQ